MCVCVCVCVCVWGPGNRLQLWHYGLYDLGKLLILSLNLFFKRFFFFLTWTIFKDFIELVTILFLFYVLDFWLWGMWGLSSLKVKVTQSCLTFCDPMDYKVHGILQASVLEWVAFPFSRGSSQPRDQTRVSCIAGGFFTNWVITRSQPWDLTTGLPGKSFSAS